jgi:hypothetical protein
MTSRRSSFARLALLFVVAAFGFLFAIAPRVGRAQNAAKASASAKSSEATSASVSASASADEEVAPAGSGSGDAKGEKGAKNEKEAAEEEEWTGPANEVNVGVYVNQITEVSLKENKFVVDFWVWFRWKADDIKPYESFEVANGNIDNKEEPTVQKVKGLNYAVLRVTATITHFFDVRAYPLDNHPLAIIIEDADSEEFKLKYIADVESSNVDSVLQMPGWVKARHEAKITTSSKHSNYGDISLPSNSESKYSSFAFTMYFERQGLQYFLKLFFGLFIAALIAFLAFFIKPTEVDPRFGLGVGAIFAAVASEYVITSVLPDTGVISLADKLHIVAFAFIFLSLVQSTWSLKLFSSEDDAKVEQSKRMDRISAILFPAAYLIVSGLCVLFR